MASKDVDTTALDVELLQFEARAHSDGGRRSSSIKIKDDLELTRVGKVPTLKVCLFPRLTQTKRWRGEISSSALSLVILCYLCVFDHSEDLDSCPS